MSAPGPLTLCVSAPGKLLLTGDYAVLEGAPALVAAVSRRVNVRPAQSKSMPAYPPEISAALRIAQSALGVSLPALEIDTRALYHHAHKLGLGTSAAGTVAVIGMAHHIKGDALGDHSTRTSILHLASEAHRAVAPQGSGIDIAASTFGGLLRFMRNEQTPLLDYLSWPVKIQFSAVFTGQSARTSELVTEVLKLKERAPLRYQELMTLMRRCAEDALLAFQKTDFEAILSTTQRYQTLLTQLGSESGASILTPAIERIVACAAKHQGAAKSSGAGGGDIAIAFFLKAPQRAAFESECAAAGFEVLALDVAAEGIRIEAD